jgi:N-acyl-D-amino-acid deacylase
MTKGLSRRDFLKRTAWAGAALSAVGTRVWSDTYSSPYGFDLLIRNGMVIDGVQDKGYEADIGIIGERIKAVGKIGKRKAKTVLDASGKVVSPGFIDIHSHSDLEPFLNPKGESKIRQGVTTELNGNCGFSAFPFNPALQDEGGELAEQLKMTIDWTDLSGYYARLNENKFAINHATLLGHGTLRTSIMGFEKREPSSKEMEQMKQLAAEAMQQGAFGLSTGLEYYPGSIASPEEVIEICKVIAEYGGIYATHIRSEDQKVIESVAEAIYIAEKAKIPLQISHFKVGGTTNWWKMPYMIDLVEKAQKRGVNIAADRYPYTAYGTGLNIFFPPWALGGGLNDFVERLKDKEMRQRIKGETLEKFKGYPWESIVIADATHDENRAFIGQNFQQIAAEKNMDPYDLLCDLLITEGGNMSHFGFAMSDENTDTVLKLPWVMLCSDGSALAPHGPLGEGVPHPRNYGSFPRFLGLYVREKKLVTLNEAIKKMTSMPASKMGLRNRGMIKEGLSADLVVFDPSVVADKATYTEPERYPVGIDYVIVNGQLVVDHEKHTGALPGKTLLGPGKNIT